MGSEQAAVAATVMIHGHLRRRRLALAVEKFYAKWVMDREKDPLGLENNYYQEQMDTNDARCPIYGGQLRKEG